MIKCFKDGIHYILFEDVQKSTDRGTIFVQSANKYLLDIETRKKSSELHTSSKVQIYLGWYDRMMIFEGIIKN